MTTFVRQWSQIAIVLCIGLSCSFAIAADVMLLGFTAESCEACEAIKPTIQSLSSSGWIIRQVDAHREPRLTQRWKVDRLPTLIVLVDGEEADRIMGEATPTQLLSRLARFAPSTVSPQRISSVTDSSKPSSYANPSFAGPFPALPDEPNLEPSLSEIASVSFTSNSDSSANFNSKLTVDERRGRFETAAITSQSTPNVQSIDPMSTAVRLRVDEGSSFAFGTGTIIAQQGEDVLVMTCGHLFRTHRGQTPITIEYFQNGQLVPTEGAVVDYACDQTDIALVRFKSKNRVNVAPLRPATEPLAEGETVASVGCDHGANPTRRDSRITKLNRYLGAPNVEVAGAPVQGRSGGGLFDASGRLIGVCYAADNELDEGLFSAPAVLYQQVAKFGMNHLYDSPAKPSGVSIASSNTPHASQTNPISPSVEGFPASSMQTFADLNASETSALAMSRAQMETPVNASATVKPPMPTYTDNFPDSRTRQLMTASQDQTPLSISSGTISSLTVIVRTSDGQQKIIDIPDAPASLVQALQLQAMPQDQGPTAIASRR